MAPATCRHCAALPSPRVAAGLVLTMLACGAVLGNAAAGGANASAARGSVLVVEDDAAAPAAAAPVTRPEPPRHRHATPPPSAPSDAEAEPSTPPPSSPAPNHAAAPSDDTSADTDTDTPASPLAPKLPPVRHVWVVALTGHSFPETFGAGATGAAPYLAGDLRALGTLLPWYHAAGHDPAASGVALLGGRRDATGPFDAQTQTLPGQLTGLGRTWKAYVEGATDGLQPGDNPCARPPELAPRNPFLLFKSLTTDPACGSSMATLDPLLTDAADSDSAPTFSYILPGPAHDGSTSLADADAWLKTVMPGLLASKAYNDAGLVVITFDTGAPDDTEAGGGRVGALLLSPFVKPGATIDAPYDAFALLASIDRLFALDPIGYAAQTKLKPFGPGVFAAWSP